MARRSSPEALLQSQVRAFLKLVMPDDVFWGADLTGTYLSPAARNKAKAMGVRRGWPDLRFLCADGVTRYVELKTATGSLEPEQRVFRDLCKPHGIWALCRSLDEVEAALRGWGVKLKSHPFRPETYE